MDLLTRAEKEKRVVELYEQDKTYREIAKEVHMSLGVSLSLGDTQEKSKSSQVVDSIMQKR
jgi:hypothetical protein